MATVEHDTDSLLGPIRLHQTDALLLAEQELEHETDTFLSGGTSEESKTHTTDALLLAEQEKEHTTDALLLAEQSRAHTTDTLLQSVNNLTHTTDALLLAEQSRAHTTDTTLQAVDNSLTHTTDAFLAGTGNLTHTTDTLLQSVNNLTHTTDTLLQAIDNSLIHTTDTFLYLSLSESHTTDTALQAVDNSLTHTTDAFLYLSLSRPHTTDTLLSVADNSLIHTTDTLLQAVDNGLIHTTDAFLRGAEEREHETDATLHALGINLTHTTDAFLQQGSTIGHTTDALLQAIDQSLTHTTDALLQAEQTLSHTTDAFLAQVNSVNHSTDATLQALDISADHSTDALLQAEQTVVHTTDALLEVVVENTHTTDTFLAITFTGTGDLNFGEFVLDGIGDHDGPGQGNLVFSNLEISGDATFVPWFRPTNEGFTLPKFSLSGAGSFSFANPYVFPEQEIRWINRQNVLTSIWGWGRDTRQGCGRPLQPFRCIVVGDSPELFGLAKKLEIIREDLPAKWPDTEIIVSLNIEAEKAKEDRAKKLADARRLNRLADSYYIEPKPEVEIDPIKDLSPEPKKAFSVTLLKAKTAKESGRTKMLPKAKERPPEEVVRAPLPTITFQKLEAPIEQKILEPKISFHRPIINAKRSKRASIEIRHPQAIKEPVSEQLPVEYINNTKPIKPVTPVAVLEEPKVAPIRTNFDIGRRRRKRH